MPSGPALLGGGLILIGVLSYIWRPGKSPGAWSQIGILLGCGSALAYAVAYALRGRGLDQLPDPAFGTFVGALVGCLWFPIIALLRADRRRALAWLFADQGIWQWVTAFALSIGQILQFFALEAISVAAVAVIGALDVLFAAGFILLLRVREPVALRRLLIALPLAILGTALMMTG